jgi:hypothetical protein
MTCYRNGKNIFPFCQINFWGKCIWNRLAADHHCALPDICLEVDLIVGEADEDLIACLFLGGERLKDSDTVAIFLLDDQ